MPKAKVNNSGEKAAAREVVISFRVSDATDTQLNEMLKRSPSVGINSNRQFCRKIVMDYINGKLAYKSAKDRMMGVEG
jgi:hypothetical protein